MTAIGRILIAKKEFGVLLIDPDRSLPVITTGTTVSATSGWPIKIVPRAYAATRRRLQEFFNRRLCPTRCRSRNRLFAGHGQTALFSRQKEVFGVLQPAPPRSLPPVRARRRA